MKPLNDLFVEHLKALNQNETQTNLAQLKYNVISNKDTLSQEGKREASIGRLFNQFGNFSAASNRIESQDMINTLYALLHQCIQTESFKNKYYDTIKTAELAELIYDIAPELKLYIQYITLLAIESLLDKNGHLDKRIYDAIDSHDEITPLTTYSLDKSIDDPNILPHQRLNTSTLQGIVGGFITNLMEVSTKLHLIVIEKNNNNIPEISETLLCSALLNQCNASLINPEAPIDEKYRAKLYDSLSEAVSNDELNNAPAIKEAIQSTLLERAYYTEKYKLEDAIKETPDASLKDAAQKTLAAVEALKERPAKERSLAALTSVLTHATAVVKDPVSSQAQDTLYESARHLNKTSAGEKVAGAICALLGAALILGSIAFAICTFGLGTPLSIAGIVATSATLAAVGSALAAKSSSCYHTGLFKNPALKSSEKLIAAAKKVADEDEKQFKLI